MYTTDCSTFHERKVVMTEKLKTPVVLTVPVVVGNRAIAGALLRMNPQSNRCEFNELLSPSNFTNWGDWDNGHTDHNDGSFR